MAPPPPSQGTLHPRAAHRQEHMMDWPSVAAEQQSKPPPPPPAQPRGSPGQSSPRAHACSVPGMMQCRQQARSSAKLLRTDCGHRCMMTGPLSVVHYIAWWRQNVAAAFTGESNCVCGCGGNAQAVSEGHRKTRLEHAQGMTCGEGVEPDAWTDAWTPRSTAATGRQDR